MKFQVNSISTFGSFKTGTGILKPKAVTLSKPLVRIQAHTNVKNMASQRVLEKAGFKKEGIVRKRIFVRGDWRDEFLYSILREEWKEPKILTRTT